MLATLCFIVAVTKAPLDLHLPACRLPVAVEALSVKLGEKMFCSPELADHVVLMELKQATPEEAKTKLAEAVDADWSLRKDTLVLSRSAGKQRILDAQWQANGAKSITDGILTLSKGLKDNPTFDETAAKKLLADLAALDKSNAEEEGGFGNFLQLAKEHARGPGGRLVIKVLQLIPSQDLGDIPVGRTVFTTSPNRLQRSLPTQVNEIIRQFRKEQDIWQRMLQANPVDQPKNGYLGTDPRFNRFQDAPVQKLLLVMNRYGPKANVQCDLSGYDSNGTPIFQSSVNLMPGSSVNLANLQKANVALSGKGDIQLSEESKTLNSFMELNYSSDQRPDANWIKILSDPVGRDPLSFATSDILFGYAQQEKVNVIADLTDAMIPATEYVKDGAINLNGYIQYSQIIGNTEISKTENWHVFKVPTLYGPPTLPENRFTCKKLIQSGLSDGYFSLDALADYAESTNSEWNAVSFFLARTLLPRSERILQELSFPAYKFYGSLSPIQRRDVAQGNPLSFVTLSPVAKERLLDIATDKLGRGDMRSGLMINGQSNSSSLIKPLSLEPTEMFAQGIKANVVNAAVVSDDSLLIGTKNSKYVAWTRFLKPEAFGEELRRGSEIYSRDDQLWPGTTFKLTLSVPLWEKALIKVEFEERRYDLRTNGYSMGNLPDAIKKRIGS